MNEFLLSLVVITDFTKSPGRAAHCELAGREASPAYIPQNLPVNSN